MKIFDPQWAQRLARILQTRGTNQEAPTEIPFAGIVITIPGESVLENLAGDTAKRATGTSFITVAAPAAGAEIFAQVPAGEAWRVLSFFARLTTSATVATRYADLRLLRGALSTDPNFFRDGIVSGQAASLFWDYTWALGCSVVVNNTGNGRSLRPFPDLVLTQGMSISTFTLNIQAGDQWSLIQLLVEKAAYR